MGGKEKYSVQGKLPPVPANVVLHQGWFKDTLPIVIKEHPTDKFGVALVHIDCDLYEATKEVLDLLLPQIMPGCLIRFDELYIFWPTHPEHWNSGEVRAWEEVAQEAGMKYELLSYWHQGVTLRVLSNPAYRGPAF